MLVSMTQVQLSRLIFLFSCYFSSRQQFVYNVVIVLTVLLVFGLVFALFIKRPALMDNDRESQAMVLENNPYETGPVHASICMD